MLNCQSALDSGHCSFAIHLRSFARGCSACDCPSAVGGGQGVRHGHTDRHPRRPDRSRRRRVSAAGPRRSAPLFPATGLPAEPGGQHHHDRGLACHPLAHALIRAGGALLPGAVIAAWAGTALFGRLSDVWLERMILALLLVIGVALIVEGLLPGGAPALFPASSIVWIVAGVTFGLAIGLVSSLLGVAGGEIIIPTLVFAYGVDIKTAGTAS